MTRSLDPLHCLNNDIQKVTANLCQVFFYNLIGPVFTERRDWNPGTGGSSGRDTDGWFTWCRVPSCGADGQGLLSLLAQLLTRLSQLALRELRHRQALQTAERIRLTVPLNISGIRIHAFLLGYGYYVTFCLQLRYYFTIFQHSALGHTTLHYYCTIQEKVHTL